MNRRDKIGLWTCLALLIAAAIVFMVCTASGQTLPPIPQATSVNKTNRTVVHETNGSTVITSNGRSVTNWPAPVPTVQSFEVDVTVKGIFTVTNVMYPFYVRVYSNDLQWSSSPLFPKTNTIKMGTLTTSMTYTNA
jgi:hypothetical protein